MSIHYISAQRLLRETWSGQLPDLYDYSARHRDFTLDASASTNRNVAREDVVQKHHQTAARCRRLLAGEPRHPWFVTKLPKHRGRGARPPAVAARGRGQSRPEPNLARTSRPATLKIWGFHFVTLHHVALWDPESDTRVTSESSLPRLCTCTR